MSDRQTGRQGGGSVFGNAVSAAERDEEVGLAAPTDLAEREAMAARAEAQAEAAEAERADKRGPYEADPLFLYLWRRGYGTSAYRGSGFVRRMDRWVAQLIDFEAARANYHILTTLPDRLHAHAARLRSGEMAA